MELALEFDDNKLSVLCNLLRDFSPILPDDFSTLSDEQLVLLCRFFRDFIFGFTAYILSGKEVKI